MSAQPVIEELRLQAFKSFRGATLPLEPMTVLVGRNSSGKSNALDGLDVLARLASGGDIRDALEARTGIGPVRGGLEGCAPHGEDHFRLGCTVRTERGAYALDVEVTVRPAWIVEERLLGPDDHGAPTEVLFRSGDPHRDAMEVHRTGRPWPAGMGYRRAQGTPPVLSRRTLLTSQLLAGLPVGDDSTDDPLRYAADQVLSALRGVFALDPVPHLMRQFVPSADHRLRRTGENLSAVIDSAQRLSPAAIAELTARMRELVDHEVRAIDVRRSDLGDVMLALDEGVGGLTPAREMSDGLLRFLAVGSVLSLGSEAVDLSLPFDPFEGPPPLTLVVEEMENGLHPTQANGLLAMLREAVQRGTRVLFTTHNPVLLSDLEATEHAGVVVCRRDAATGASTLDRLTELPGYPEAVASGSLGRALTRGLLDRDPPPRDVSEFNRILGIT